MLPSPPAQRLRTGERAGRPCYGSAVTVSAARRAAERPNSSSAASELSGPSCNYAAGKSMGAVVIAMDDAAVMKLGGALKRFTLDPQCDKLEKGTGSRYVAPGYVLDLAVKKESRSEQAGKVGFQGSVKLSDGQGRVLYSTEGDVQCGG